MNTDLAAELRGGRVTPELDHGPGLAQAVGRLAAVVGKVLLAHAGHCQGVSPGVPVVGDEVSPPAQVSAQVSLSSLLSPGVQRHVVLEPDHLRPRLSVDCTGELRPLARPALHQALDRPHVGRVQHVQPDLEI